MVALRWLVKHTPASLPSPSPSPSPRAATHPSMTRAVGVPAAVIKRLDEFEEPVKQMDQVSGFVLDFVI